MIFLKPNLKKILDIEKLHRKINLSLCNPYEFYSLHISYQYLIKCIEIINNKIPNITDKYKQTILNLDNFMNEYQLIFNLNELEKYSLTNMTTSVFQINIYSDIDNLQSDINNIKNNFNIIKSKLDLFIDSNKKSLIKSDNNEKYGYHLYTTEPDQN